MKINSVIPTIRVKAAKPAPAPRPTVGLALTASSKARIRQGTKPDYVIARKSTYFNRVTE